MDSCCSSSSVEAKAEIKQAALCPSCGTPAKPVGLVTLMHQVVAPLNQQLGSEKFYFCSSPACDSVYFSDAGTVIEACQVRAEIGQKSIAPGRVICYCFDISHARAMEELEQTGTSASKAFVVEQTRLKNCACDIRNPSGRCCLKEFPK